MSLSETEIQLEKAHLQKWIQDVGYVVNPSVGVLRHLSDTLDTGNGRVNILITDAVRRIVDREYVTGSQLAQLAVDGDVSVRCGDLEYQQNIVVTEDAVGAFVDFDGVTFAVGAANDEVINQLRPVVESVWGDLQDVTFDLPPCDTVGEVLVSTFSSEFYNTYRNAVEVMTDVAYQDATDLSRGLFADKSHIHASLLLAGAKCNSSLREVGECAEAAELANRSTLSREKQTLEHNGFITTESTPSGQGRPPMQLLVPDEYRDEDTRLLAERIYEVL